MKAIALGPQLSLQLTEHLLFFSTRLNAFDGFAIHTRRAPIGLYLFPCLPKHVRAPYLVVQTVELHSFRLLGCAILGSLQLPNLFRFVSSHKAIKLPQLL